MMVFCTLFDSNYADKGLVMYQSLRKLGVDFKLYILAMDDQCYRIISKKACSELIPIELSAFLNERLRIVKESRARAEFCWTCTSFLIDYVLTQYHEEICTYIDSDLYFYENPEILLSEMNEKSVQIVAHRFTNSPSDQERRKRSGTYCVQFNTFRNSKDALDLLHKWEQQCLESCSISSGQPAFGDQGYLENWGEYSNVSVLQHLGGGVAPWNIAQYKLVSSAPQILLEEKKTGKRFPLIFYHYHNLKYCSASEIDIGVFKYNWGTDKNLIEVIYPPYLRELNSMKSRLRDEFGIYPLLKSHPGMSSGEKHKSLLDQMLDIFKAGSINKLFTVIDTKIRIKLNKKRDIIRIWVS